MTPDQYRAMRHNSNPNSNPVEGKMTRKEKQRKSAIIAELSRMSKDGWLSSHTMDYLPLERELAAINRDFEYDHAVIADWVLDVGDTIKIEEA